MAVDRLEWSKNSTSRIQRTHYGSFARLEDTVRDQFVGIYTFVKVTTVQSYGNVYGFIESNLESVVLSGIFSVLDNAAIRALLSSAAIGMMEQTSLFLSLIG